MPEVFESTPFEVQEYKPVSRMVAFVTSSGKPITLDRYGVVSVEYHTETTSNLGFSTPTNVVNVRVQGDVLTVTKTVDPDFDVEG